MRLLKFLLILTFLTGCSKSISNVSHSNRYQEINNPELNSKVVVFNIVKRRLNDLLNVAVEVRNVSNITIDLEYRFIWLDNDGFKVDKTPWLPLTLSGKQTKFVEQIAHFKSAVDLKFEYREK